MWEHSQTPWAYVGSGAALILNKDPAAGIERFQQALNVGSFRRYISGEATLAYRGEAHILLGQLDKGIEDLEEALVLRPNRLGTRVSMAIAYRRADRTEDALAALEPLYRAVRD